MAAVPCASPRSWLARLLPARHGRSGAVARWPDGTAGDRQRQRVAPFVPATSRCARVPRAFKRGGCRMHGRDWNRGTRDSGGWSSGGMDSVGVRPRRSRPQPCAPTPRPPPASGALVIAHEVTRPHRVIVVVVTCDFLPVGGTVGVGPDQRPFGGEEVHCQ